MFSKVRRNPQSKSKYKYAYNSKFYEVDVSKQKSLFFDEKVGSKRVDPICFTFPDKINQNNSFILEKLNDGMKRGDKKGSMTSKKKEKVIEDVKLPELRKGSNPEEFYNESNMEERNKKKPNNYYQSKVLRALKSKENTYLMSLARQHFLQTIQAIRNGKGAKLSPIRQIKIPKKNQHFKTIFLDLDQCLVHCDQFSSNYSVKLKFPIEGGAHIFAGVKIRPHCQEFLKELAQFAEIIIFTASAASYADVVLDYLDPDKSLFSYRLYRHHCTLEKGYFIKDLRIVNRKAENCVIVDNSALSFMCQPSQGVPILPFYNFSKDKELLALLQFLRQLVKEDDMRIKIREVFFWEKYCRSNRDSRKLFMEEFVHDEGKELRN